METEKEDALLSIGGLSVACGIPVETLRNWERRYGFPEPVRLKSGHRRYPMAIVPRLRLIRATLDKGYRPSFAVMASVRDLTGAAELASDVGEERPAAELERDLDLEVEKWLDDVARLDAAALERDLRRAWTVHGGRRFVLSLAVPFLREIGDRWFDGRHTVGHEHLASETLQSFLAAQWRPMSDGATGARMVLANLEGELHSLGIHMAALFMAMKGFSAVFLGANTPLDSIVEAARRVGVVAVIIGLSEASRVSATIARLEELRRRLPSEMVAAVGGNDTVLVPNGVVHIPTFDAFDAWLDAAPFGDSNKGQ